MIQVRLLILLFILSQLFPQSGFHALTQEQKDEFDSRKLFLSVSDDNKYNWTAFEGDNSLKESELYKRLDIDVLYTSSIKRDKKVRNRFIGGLVMLSASLYMILNYNDLQVPASGETAGYDCPPESEYCYKTEWPYRMYGYGLGIFSVYNLYSAYFNSSFYNQLASSDDLQEIIKKYNLILFKSIVSES